MLSVLLVVDSLDGGGAERHVTDLAAALHAHGVHVEVACSAAGVLAPALTRPPHVLGRRLVKRRGSPAYAARLARLVRALRPDVVHAHCHASAVAAALATLGTGARLVVTEHTEAPWRGPLARAQQRLVCRRADALLAVSRPVAARLVGTYGADPARVLLAPPAVRALPGHLPADLGADLPANLGADGRPVVGFLGRLVASKGVDVLVEAARLLPEATVVVLGDGPERERLLASAPPSVHVLPWRGDARALLPRFAVLAVPSRSDGSPLVVREAQLAGVPVVGSAVGGIPDLLAGVTGPPAAGLLVPPADPAALAAALRCVLTDAGLRSRLAAAGRVEAERHGAADMLVTVLAAYRPAELAGQARQAARPEALLDVPALPGR